MATSATTAKRGLAALVLLGIGLIDTRAQPAGAADAPPVLMSTETVEAKPAWSTLEELIAAAEGGDALAAFQYGQLLEFGDQVEADPAKARRFYEVAAQGGNANAAFALGKAYADGTLGLKRDPARALEFYRRAAADVPEAVFNLGAAYVSGRGVRRDYVEGLAWLLVAQERGAGGDAVDQVKKRLAKYPDRVAAAQKRAEVLRRELDGTAQTTAAAKAPTSPATPAPKGPDRPEMPAPVQAPPARVAPVPPSKADVPRPNFALPPPRISLPPPPPAPEPPATDDDEPEEP